VFNRPNGFGKTLNLDMLKVFFEKTNNDTSIYFKDKKIWFCGQEYREQQGKYPVIYVSFKDAKGNSFEEVAKKILAEFQREFKRHSELLNSKSLSIYEKEDYLRYLSSQQNPLMGDWALKDLSHLLYKHHNIETIIIIDDYDTPILNGLVYGFYNEIFCYIRNVCSSALEGNHALEKGFLSGKLNFSFDMVLFNFNDVFHPNSREFFGFTQDEVKEMVIYYNVLDKYQEIKEWYGGYNFRGIEIFNPWSIVNYFNNNCQAQPYYNKIKNNDIIHFLSLCKESVTLKKLQKLQLKEKFVMRQ
jgi:hypothetical protein